MNVLKAPEGQWLTQADPQTNPADRIFATELSLATTDSPDNYTTVTDSQRQAMTPATPPEENPT